jgi:hypothetical protein
MESAEKLGENAAIILGAAFLFTKQPLAPSRDQTRPRLSHKGERQPWPLSPGAEPFAAYFTAGIARHHASIFRLSDLPSEAKRIDNQCERRGNLSTAGIVEVVSGERRAPIRKHAEKLTTGNIRLHMALGEVGQA